MIARVFPRRTAMTPRDGLAFFKEPTIENIADCIKENVTEVHISVTFTWDILRAEDLYYAWQILGVPVEVGGPAFDDRMGDFTPGLYLRDGLVFTSRGCTKDCWFCSVPRCARGTVRELPITDGWNILDDNILGTSEQHFRDVCTMLKRQNHPAVFSGGLEPALLQQWQAELLYDVRPDRLYTAYDTKDDLEPLIEMGRKLRAAGWSGMRATALRMRSVGCTKPCRPGSFRLRCSTEMRAASGTLHGAVFNVNGAGRSSSGRNLTSIGRSTMTDKLKRSQKQAYEKQIKSLRALANRQLSEIKKLQKNFCWKNLEVDAAEWKRERAEAERDALLEIAKKGKDCETCKNSAVCVQPGTDVAHWCDRCAKKCLCYGCGGDRWEWRGLP